MATGRTVNRNGTDAHVSADFPSLNTADAKQLWLRADHSFAYLWFNRPFPLGAQITSAILRVYTKDAWNASPTLTVRRISQRWRVNTITYNNRPDVVGGTGYTQQKTSNADGDVWEFDITGMLQNISDGTSWFGVRIETTATGARALYSAQSSQAYKPELEVSWSLAPQPPSTLNPSGDRAVSVSHPVLSFDFTDVAGSTSLAAVHVQVDPAGNWAAPAFDSGAVSTTEEQLDLSTTAYAGLAAGASTQWRVRVQDGSGLWSGWSDAASFTRDPKGTLTITNPPSTGVVTDWSPPVIWSLTGETQRAWQVIVTPEDDHTTHLHNTGRVNGTDTSHTIPFGVIREDIPYRVYVRLWDTKDRVRTVGDNAFTQTYRTFTFTEDPTVNPATSLTVENLLPRPWVRLRWARTEAPDRFVLKRNGKVVEPNLDPAEVMTSAGQYEFVDKEPKPYREHTWVVQSVVNKVTSSGNPSVTTWVRQQGIWLVDRARNIDVWINGSDEGTWAFGEEATTHHPLNATQGVRITQSMRGYEGTITGVLTPGAGATLWHWENNLLKIKERPNNAVVLSAGDESFRCLVYNISIWPTPTVPITKKVSFDFHQIGNLDFRPRYT